MGKGWDLVGPEFGASGWMAGVSWLGLEEEMRRA